MRLPHSAIVSIAGARFIPWFLSALFPVYVIVILILNPIDELFYLSGSIFTLLKYFRTLYDGFES